MGRDKAGIKSFREGGRIKEYREYDWLYNEYVTKNMNCREIGELFGVHKDTIRYHLKKLGIPRRTSQESTKPVYEVYKDKDWLHKKHNIEMLSIREIAEGQNVDKGTVVYHMKKTEVSYRDRIESVKLVGEQGKINRSNALKGEKHPWFGTKPPEEQKCNARKAIREKWKGHITSHNAGYLTIRDPENHVKYLQHRYVMQKHIGRELKANEVVHHKDGNKKNNDIDNLFLFKSLSHHAYYHKMEQLEKPVQLKYEYEHLTEREKMKND